jgi:hypothetical protein
LLARARIGEWSAIAQKFRNDVKRTDQSFEGRAPPADSALRASQPPTLSPASAASRARLSAIAIAYVATCLS